MTSAVRPPTAVYVDACPGRNATGFGVTIKIAGSIINYSTATRGHLTTVHAEGHALLMGIDLAEAVLRAHLALSDKSRKLPAVRFHTDSMAVFNALNKVNSNGVPKKARMYDSIRQALIRFRNIFTDSCDGTAIVVYEPSKTNPADRPSKEGLEKWKDRWR